MENDYKKYISPLCIIVVAVYVICCLIKRPQEIGDYTTYAGYSASFITVLSVLYINWIWKWGILRVIGFEEIPVLYNKYEGNIKYDFNGIGTKQIKLEIKQNLLSIKIKMITDINKSYTVTSKIVKQNDEYVLYYTYQTNPQSICRDENPQQYGTTQIFIEDTQKLEGIYWTTQKTTGDILVYKV